MIRRGACVVAGAAMALLVAASPASAYKHGTKEDNDWNGAINVLNANQLQVPICVAQNNIGVLGAAIPILSPMFMGSCATAQATVEH